MGIDVLTRSKPLSPNARRTHLSRKNRLMDQDKKLDQSSKSHGDASRG
nr:MAG TPA: hypothetical protein [Caudoviricetes sp.]